MPGPEDRDLRKDFCFLDCFLSSNEHICNLYMRTWLKGRIGQGHDWDNWSGQPTPSSLPHFSSCHESYTKTLGPAVCWCPASQDLLLRSLKLTSINWQQTPFWTLLPVNKSSWKDWRSLDVVADPFKLSIREAKARGSLSLMPALSIEPVLGKQGYTEILSQKNQHSQPPPKKDDCLQKGVDISELQYSGEIWMLQD